MAPKKKKLSPEERKKLLAEKKLQKKLAAEEAKRQIKRDHLLRELQYGELNRRKLEKGWREMLLNIKLPQMRADIEVCMNIFDRALDLKDCQINLLKNQLDEAEEQYQINFRGHCENMEKVLGIFHDMLDELKGHYDNRLKGIVKSALAKNKGIAAKKALDDDYINVILYRLDMESTYINRIVKGDYLSKHDGEVKQAFDTLQLLRATEEHRFENIWEQYENTLNVYVKEIQERIEGYNKLQKLDEQMRSEIKQQNACICQRHELIRQLRLNQITEQNNMEETLCHLSFEKNHFSDAVDILKLKFSRDLANDKQQINLLVKESDDMIKYFETLYNISENILKWKILCNKYETEEDKMKISDEETLNEFAEKINKFSEQVAKVQVHKLKLIKKKEQLSEENNLLKIQLQQYCSDAGSACRFFNAKRLQDKLMKID